MITPQLEEKVEKIIKSFGFELYDMVFLKENKNDILRISLAARQGDSEANAGGESNGGNSDGKGKDAAKKQVTLDVCQEISEALSPLLDVEIPQEKAYFLEVSSPGVERVLKTPRHFALSLGLLVAVRLEDKQEFEGVLVGFENDEAVFEVAGEPKSYKLGALKKVKTILEW